MWAVYRFQEKNLCRYFHHLSKLSLNSLIDFTRYNWFHYFQFLVPFHIKILIFFLLVFRREFQVVFRREFRVSKFALVISIKPPSPRISPHTKDFFCEISPGALFEDLQFRCPIVIFLWIEIDQSEKHKHKTGIVDQSVPRA